MSINSYNSYNSYQPAKARWMADAIYHSQNMPKPEEKYNVLYSMQDKYKGKLIFVGPATRPEWNDYGVYESLGYEWFGKLLLSDGTICVRPDNSYEHSESDKKYVKVFRLNAHNKIDAQIEMKELGNLEALRRLGWRTE